MKTVLIFTKFIKLAPVIYQAVREMMKIILNA